MTQFLKTTQIAIDGAKTLPRRYYVAPEIFAEETDRIFTRRWLCVGREDRIAGPGDYFVQQVGKESIIVPSRNSARSRSTRLRPRVGRRRSAAGSLQTRAPTTWSSGPKPSIGATARPSSRRR